MKNSEGYYDFTAGIAIRNVMREEAEKRKAKKKKSKKKKYKKKKKQGCTYKGYALF